MSFPATTPSYYLLTPVALGVEALSQLETMEEAKVVAREMEEEMKVVDRETAAEIKAARHLYGVLLFLITPC